MAGAPVLKTTRLTLRQHQPGDLDDLFAMRCEPAVYRYTSGKPSTREDCWTRILRYIGHWQALGFGYWAILDNKNKFIGEIGFADYQREIIPPLHGMPELGWALKTSAQGNGYATEALAAVMEWGEATLPHQTWSAIISPQNAPSLRLATKFGFTEDCRTTYLGEEIVLLLRPSPTSVEHKKI